MKIRFWGTRGSIPSPGPSTVRYGGNTSCVEVRLEDGTLIIVDAGSGIRALGASLIDCNAVVLLSHYHWDHIQGMPFFAPAYSPHSAIRVMGPEYEGAGPYAVLTGEMLRPYFPAPITDWRGLTEFGTVTAGESFAVGGATVRASRLCHPGLTLGFRIQEGDQTFVYISDNEPGLASSELLSGMIDLASDADLLVHDCQYSEPEYPGHRHWGHSTPRQTIHVAVEAGVRKLLLFHHDPSHSDEQVDALAEEANQLAAGIEVRSAREGESLHLGQQTEAIHRSA